MKIEKTFKITTINVILAIISFCVAGFIWDNDIPWGFRTWLIAAAIWNSVIVLKLANRGIRRGAEELRQLKEQLRQERALEYAEKDIKANKEMYGSKDS